MSESTPPSELPLKRQRRRPYHPLGDSQAAPDVPEPVIDTPNDDNGTDQRAQRRRRAQVLVQRHALLSSAVALLPLPIFDTLAMIALQVNLIHRLARLYGVPFSRERSRALLVSLLMGAEFRVLSTSAVQFIPGWGYLTVTGPQAVLFLGLSYTVGKVFTQHFEAGGTLLDFDPEAMRSFFQQELALQRRQPPRRLQRHRQQH